ncbi:MAG: trypsin-like peptidase domain-containing protein [Pirellulales bacterium]
MVKYAIAALVLAASAAQAACAGGVQLLDFSSPFCGPCQSMVPLIHSLEAAGYPIRKVDTTREPGVAQQYGVTQIPCFIMLVDGRETERIVGAQSQDALVAMFQRAMALRTQSPDAQILQSPDAQMTQTAAQAPAQAGTDPWSGVGNSGGAMPGVGGGDAPARDARPMTHTAPLGPREPLKDAFSGELISSSVRLRVDDAKGRSYGTGTIIDARSGEALVITCGHLFRDSQGKGPVTVELFESTPEGPRVIAQLPGQVINFNLDRDLGLVSIRPDRPVRVAPIAPTQTILARGDRLVSVGCDRGQDPTALATRVTNVDRYQGPPNVEASGAPIEGRSGGGLFNTAGQLVGVCFAADYEGNEGLYTALESIHSEMDRLNLSDIYRTAKTNPTQSPATSATPPIVRGQEPLQPVMPQTAAAAAPSSAGPIAGLNNSATNPPSGMSGPEQAALEEIMGRATDAEVVCIIRPRDAGGKSEVITLDRVSPEFVRALAERAKTAPDTMLR